MRFSSRFGDGEGGVDAWNDGKAAFAVGVVVKAFADDDVDVGFGLLDGMFVG